MSNPYGPPGGYRPPGYGQQPYPAQWQRPRPVQRPPDHDRARRVVGLLLWIMAMAAGVILNLSFTFLEVATAGRPAQMLAAVAQGALFALVPLCFYLIVPTVLDRYDPEPWWCLALVFLWGAVVATGFAGFINTFVDLAASALLGAKAGSIITAVVSAPLSEELFKGLAILGVFYFLRREFDGVVDGIIYAIFCALGFAAVENISYYARAEMHHQLGATFFVRGILAPWGHPLYTSMTGIGFGIARESTRTWVRWIAPLGGYLAGVTLHAVWNLSATVFKGAFVLMIPLWLAFVLSFLGLVVILVMRKGRTIRKYLRDEVLLGNLSQEEVDLICSPVGRLKCTLSWRGATGRAFIAAGARLALSKWHTARAMRGKKQTISADFIVPLRQELHRLRGVMLQRMPR